MSSNKFAFSFAAMAAAGSASAVIIDFNSHPNDFAPVIFDSGYQFTFTAQGWGVLEDSFAFSPPMTQNGTTRIIASGATTANANVIFKPQDDSPFNLVSMDVASGFTGTSNTIDIIGFLEGGGQVMTSLPVGAFANTVLPGTFVNLDSVQVISGTNAPFITDPGFGLDNIQVEAVPEPATITVLLIGAGALLLRRRNR